MLAPLMSRLRGFREDRDGSYSIEAILVLPMLAWAILAMFSYFDGLRLANANIKAAHTISDVLSRESSPINDAYIDGTYRLMTFLINRGYDSALRVSVYRYDGDDQQFEVMWSETRGTSGQMNAATPEQNRARLPITADGDTIIVVETWMDYRSAFVMGLKDTTLFNFVVTSPRFAPQVLFDDGTLVSTS
ncbi:TadE/TadG family type IV pilus assembly protein [Oceaniovalibus sp. ACAM 378]|uniref:TadE/TadG family type IV pilus assembly protein n=1 Tax=Oceaniovalibus sp. ACAM 378 TaxID=2599923 RepID=UPI0011D8E298|nr:pilus assembly protein [Oceaniovalibus sp. ACAM 378]TYB87663.1 pilus assembly protein [Oceaniovalibus sp. ACAM 378]